MGKIRTRRQARSLGRQGFAFAAVAAFLLINAYLLLRQRAPALDQEVVAGEGAHRRASGTGRAARWPIRCLRPKKQL